MRCETVVRHLDAFRTGELEAELKATVGAHLTRCPACSSALAGLRSLAAGLSRLKSPAPANLLANVLGATGDSYGVVDTSLGRAWVAFNPRGITFVRLESRDDAGFEAEFAARWGRSLRPAPLPARYADAVRRAAAGEEAGDAPIDVEALAPFEREVLRVLAAIPRGEVRPYAWLAREAGSPRAVRAVGNAMARNPVPLLLPCHRVVPSGGGVGNYAFGSDLKRRLLEREGVPMDELDALARRGVRYLGCRTTHIYCHPTCRDIRRARPENRVQLADAGAAAAAGYRPCRHCRPLADAA